MMNSSEATPPSTTINIADTASEARGTAPLVPPPPSAAPRAPIFTFFRKTKGEGGWKRGVALFDFILRICAIGSALAAAIVMGTTDETLPFFTEHYQFHASYDDLPALLFLLIANAIVAGYLVLSLPLSIISIIRPNAVGPHLLLLISDLVMVALTTAAASSATAIVYLAHTGNSKANWVAICLRFDDFCQQISRAVVASFVAILFLMMMVVMSALALKH